MKLFYKPFALIAAFIAARVGRAVFKSVWSRLDDADPPDPGTANATFTKVVAAAALEGATMASVAAAVDRASAKAFHHLTGIWPGEADIDV
jgi:pectin methylesterase-like acyl-CoA thioesterase